MSDTQLIACYMKYMKVLEEDFNNINVFGKIMHDIKIKSFLARVS